MSHENLISVVISVRNGAPWIQESIQSILDQTHQPAEILVGDDASTDGTPELIEAMGSPLVRVLRSAEHKGISRQCNEMMAQARGRYIARMDADDIALPERFRIQMETFQKSNVSVLGTWARRFGAADTLHAPPAHHDQIRAMLGLSCPFVNPTVIFDRQRLGEDPTYDPSVPFGEDHDQFARLRHKAVFGNIPQVLLLWRLHKKNAGSDPRTLSLQSQTVSKVRSSIWNESGIQLEPAEEQALDRLIFLPLPEIKDSKHLLSAFCKPLAHPRPEELWAPVPALRELFLEHWEYYCRVRAWGNKSILPVWWKGTKRLGGSPSAKTLATLALKSFGKPRT